MGKFIDETGNKYGRLTVLKKSEKRTSSGSVKWICQCECGNLVEVAGDVLRRGLTVSCGCFQKQKVVKDEIGHKYGKLTVLRRAPSREHRAYWVCQCECGNIVEISGNNLRQGQQGCGCGQIKNRIGNKYGKLTSTQNIIQEISNNENIKEKKKNEGEEKIIMRKRKRKRHDSSDEEENKKEKKEEKKEKEEFVDKLNKVDEIIEEKENQIKDENSKEKNEELKDTWKQKFISINDLNDNKIEIKEMSKSLDDPMKNLLSKNKLIEETDELIKKRGFYLPRCKFPPLINRFNIKPGYRWDGFNRSNGFENKIMNLKFNINSN